MRQWQKSRQRIDRSSFGIFKYMSVTASGLDTGVAQKFLHDIQRNFLLYQPRGKCMAQRMGIDIFQFATL